MVNVLETDDFAFERKHWLRSKRERVYRDTGQRLVGFEYESKFANSRMLGSLDRYMLEPEDGWHMCKYLKFGKSKNSKIYYKLRKNGVIGARLYKTWKSSLTGGSCEFRRTPQTKASKQRKGCNKVPNWTIRVEFMRAFQKFHIGSMYERVRRKVPSRLKDDSWNSEWPVFAEPTHNLY